jgi:formylglycine-generating enzyme required for sulfatase activity
MTPDEAAARRAVERFLTVVEERTGLLAARGEGVYAFSHLTFQEYLAALAVAARDDYVEVALAHSAAAWWREVILLTAGYLSTQSKERATKLIRAIAENKDEPELFHNLVLAAECLRDVGENRVEGNLGEALERRLQADFWTRPPSNLWGKIQLRLSQGATPEDVTRRRIAAATALAQIGGGKRVYWTQPYGEPEWITIPTGEFRMGAGSELHKLALPEYQIARVPVTNVQYALFVKAAGYKAPPGWEENRPPKGKESHPVVCVSWDDASAYCAWLSKMTGKAISLPSEAEWEKAARGNQDQRAYPWGDAFDASHCNTFELGLKDTTPVGIFLEGASPYGLLDMSGNVWEWTRSLYGKYPYPSSAQERAERENVKALGNRALRGGSWLDDLVFARVSYRDHDNPDVGYLYFGFRVVVFALPS